MARPGLSQRDGQVQAWPSLFTLASTVSWWVLFLMARSRALFVYFQARTVSTRYLILKNKFRALSVYLLTRAVGLFWWPDHGPSLFPVGQNCVYIGHILDGQIKAIFITCRSGLCLHWSHSWWKDPSTLYFPVGQDCVYVILSLIDSVKGPLCLPVGQDCVHMGFILDCQIQSPFPLVQVDIHEDGSKN